MSEKVEKTLKQVIFVGSAIILLLPLFVYRGVVYPYIFSKVIAFQIIVEIIFVVWIFLAVYNKSYRPNWRNPLIISSTIFILILFLTSITGVDFQRSFWSTQERMTGVLTLIHFWLWFLILASTFGSKRRLTQMKARTNADISENQRGNLHKSAYPSGSEDSWRDWRKLIFVSLISSLLVGLYGLGQTWGWQFLLKEEGVKTATLGNPIFLAAYAMLHIFLAGFLLLREKKWLGRISMIFFLVFNLVIMFLAGSRGVLAAFGLTTSLFIIYLIFVLPSKKIKLILGSVLILLIIVVLGGIIFLQTQKDKPWIYRAPVFILKIVYLTATAEQRSLAWAAGWQGFKEKPVLGWGWENYNVIFNKYYQPYYLRLGEGATWFDRSHNQIIDTLSLTGIIGLISYLFIWFSLFWLLFKKFRREKEKRGRIFVVILATMFFVYFIQNLTVFDTPAPLIVFYFSLGLVYFMTLSSPTNCESRLITNNEKLKIVNCKLKINKQFPLPIMVILIIIFLPLIIYQFNLKPFLASRDAIKGLSLIEVSPQTSLEWYKKSLSRNTFINPEVRLNLIKSLIDKKIITNKKISEEDIKFVVSEMEKNIKEHPNDARYFIYLGQLYNIVGQQEAEYLKKAENVLIAAKKLSPQRQQIYYALANTKILKRDTSSAAELLKEAIDLDPQVGESHKFLGLLYLQNQQTEQGLAEIEEAEKTLNIYQDSSIALYVATAYFEMGNIKRAIFLSEHAQKIDPNNVQIYIHLSVLYKAMGDKERAVSAVKKAVELNPDLAAEAENFLKSLK